MRNRILPRAACAVLFLSAAACAAPQGEAAQNDTAVTTSQSGANQLSDAERADGWRLLFDGESTDGWRGFRADTIGSGWQAVDGALTRVSRGGDIITRDQFRNFELMLDWKLQPGGNSGVFYRASEEVDVIYHGAPELQVLDDSLHADGASPLTSSGANYGLHPAPRGVVRAVGEWNTVRLVVDGTRVEHWLNGQRIVEYELASEDWERRVLASKFKDWPRYGRAEEGHIGLQDHGDWVAYRNVKVRPLP